MNNFNDIYITGINCTRPRIDTYGSFRVHIGENNIPKDSIIARIEYNQLTIIENSDYTEICRLQNLHSNNLFNCNLHYFKQLLVECKKDSDNYIWKKIKFEPISHILWPIRYSTLYTIKEKIHIWNQIPELYRYLLDEDLYDIVNYKPAGRCIIFSGTRRIIRMEIYDPQKDLINMRFIFNHQSKSDLEILFKNILSKFRIDIMDNNNNLIENVENLCKNNLNCEFRKKGMHNQSGIEYLLFGPESDIFNCLYRIGMRYINDSRNLLEYN